MQVGARRAAQAAVAEQRDFVRGPAHHRVVDADRAEFVDDHGRVAAFERREKAAYQGGLACAQKAGDDCHRDARAARALLPAAEGADFVRFEQVEFAHGIENRSVINGLQQSVVIRLTIIAYLILVVGVLALDFKDRWEA